MYTCIKIYKIYLKNRTIHLHKYVKDLESNYLQIFLFYRFLVDTEILQNSIPS